MFLSVRWSQSGAVLAVLRRLGANPASAAWLGSARRGRLQRWQLAFLFQCEARCDSLPPRYQPECWRGGWCRQAQPLCMGTPPGAAGTVPRRLSGEADMWRTNQAFGDTGGDGTLIGCERQERQLHAQDGGGRRHQPRHSGVAGGAIGMDAGIALRLSVIGSIDRYDRACLMVVSVLVMAKVIGMDARLMPADAGSYRPRPLDGQQQKDQHDTLHGAEV